jgi:predicted negative regulator of RcsB-dependent stress response
MLDCSRGVRSKRGSRLTCSTMAWEQRGTTSYYYKKEREGSRVRSVYVGRGEVAQMVSKLQSSSAELEKLMRAKRSIEANELERAEATLDLAIELTQLFTQAALLVAGFHTHHRQWRRKRNGREC